MRRQSRKRRTTAVAESLETRSLLTVITVTSLADDTADDGETTLREAVAQAEATAEADEIVFASGLSGVLTLTQGQIDIGESDLIITGNGRDQTIIDGGGSDSSIFSEGVLENTTVLRSLTLRNARSAVSTSVYDDYYGGGGTLTIENALITGHSSHGLQLHGLGYSDNSYASFPNFNIRNSTVSGNSGRGISAVEGSQLEITDSIIEDNTDRGILLTDFGYSFLAPETTISGSIVRDNSTSSGPGGGILHSGGTLSIEDSVISGNATNGAGGGIFSQAYARPLQIARSTISGNTSSERGGGVYIGSEAARITNSTISGNTAENGAGIFVDVDLYGELELRNSTITNNTASQTGGGVFLDGTFIAGSEFESNIIADNAAGSDGPDIGFSQLPDAADILFEHNLLGSNEGTPFDATGTGAPDANGNLIGDSSSLIDPQLSPLTDFGLLPVHVLSTGSPALDLGSNSLNLTTDQVGNTRQIDSGVDIGAVEGTLSPITITNATVVETDTGTSNLVFEVRLNEAASGPFTLTASTVDGTATASAGDYQPLSETLSFDGTAGETRQVTVLVNGDIRVEETTSLGLQLSDVVGADLSLPPSATGTIIDNDAGKDVRLEGQRLFVAGTDSNDNIELDLNGDAIDILRNGEQFSIDAADVGVVEISGLAGDDNIVFRFVDAPTIIDAGPGNDTVKGGVGNDTIIGGDGDDQLRGTMGDDSILGGDGNDFLEGQNDNDSIRGGDGNDTISGDDGEDRIWGDAGDDILTGGDGDDFVRGDTGNDSVSGGAGSDLLIGAGGADTLVGGSSDDRIRGGGGNDALIGGAGNDTVSGGNGTDVIRGHSGADLLNGGDGRDQILGGNGSDTIHGRGGDDILAGENGDDYIIGLTGRDIVYGGGGDDELRGGGSDDLLIAGTLVPDQDLSVLTHLEALFEEWRSDRSYEERTENIRNGPNATSDRLNTTYLLADGPDQNVFDDNNSGDILRGGVETDYFFARLGQDLLDRTSDEDVDEI